MGAVNLPFLFVDGEGGNNPDGSHSYMVMCGWSEHTGPLILKNDDNTPLRTMQILDWLLDLHGELKSSGHPHTFVGFGFGYDTAMILNDLPEHCAWRLYSPGRAGWLNEKGLARWTVWGPYMMRFMGSELTLSETTLGIGHRADKATRRTLSLWDIWKFFQGSFVKALTEWEILSPAELADMEEMKRRRSTFDADSIDQEIVDYCLSECKAGVALMTKLDDTCRDLGYPLRRYDGAGSLAAAMMTAWGIKQYMDDVPEKMRRAVSCAYSGGWFEYATIGRIRQPVYQWDINSAYPTIIQHLPCLKHAEWEASKNVEPFGLYEVEFKYPSPCRWGALPYRDRHGAITHPQHGTGWYYGCEIIAAERLYPGSHHIRRGWKLIRKCDHVPFAEVPNVYQQRLALGASAAGIVLKLGLNSLYGKTAQSVGQPPFANYLWAGMITAGCRAMILLAMAVAGPENVAGIATDAIYTTREISLPSSPGKHLGEWDRSVSANGVLVIQPGITISYDEENTPTYKSRGMGKREFAGHAASAEKQWKQLGIHGSFRASSVRFIGIKTALARGKYHTRCRWVPMSAALRFYPGIKRHVPDDQLIAHFFGKPVETIAPEGSDDASYPYRAIERQWGEGYHEKTMLGDQPAPECELLELVSEMMGDA